MTDSKSFDSFQEKDPLINIVYELVSFIKENNFTLAHQIVLEYKLSFFNISLRTQRLKLSELARFADFVICHTEKCQKK